MSEPTNIDSSGIFDTIYMPNGFDYTLLEKFVEKYPKPTGKNEMAICTSSYYYKFIEFSRKCWKLDKVFATQALAAAYEKVVPGTISFWIKKRKMNKKKCVFVKEKKLDEGDDSLEVRKVLYSRGFKSVIFVREDGYYKRNENDSWKKPSKGSYPKITFKHDGKGKVVGFHHVMVLAFKDRVKCTSEDLRRKIVSCKYLVEIQKLVRKKEIAIDHDNGKLDFEGRHRLDNLQVMTFLEHSEKTGKSNEGIRNAESYFRYSLIGDFKDLPQEGFTAPGLAEFLNKNEKAENEKKLYSAKITSKAKIYRGKGKKSFSYRGFEIAMLPDPLAPKGDEICISNFIDEEPSFEVNVETGCIRTGPDKKWTRGTVNKARGYYMIRGPKTKKMYQVHRLLCMAAWPAQWEEVCEKHGKVVVCHLNDIRTDNRWENLRPGTSSENAKQRYENARKRQLEKDSIEKSSKKQKIN
jgi:hypothetical protein